MQQWWKGVQLQHRAPSSRWSVGARVVRADAWLDGFGQQRRGNSSYNASGQQGVGDAKAYIGTYHHHHHHRHHRHHRRRRQQQKFYHRCGWYSILSVF